MAKENVKKFYDLLNGSEELQKELQRRDKEYAETHKVPADDASDEEKAEFRVAAVKDLVLPLAKEQGLEFTIDEMIEYEKEMSADADAELDREELCNVTGGAAKKNVGVIACFFIGVGVGIARGSDYNEADCFGIGIGVALCW